MPVDTNLDPHAAHKAGAPITDPGHMLPEHASESRGKQGGGWVRMVVILLLIAGVVAFIVWRIRSNNATTANESRRSAAAANRPTPVQTAIVQQKTVPVYLTALGTVTAYNTVTLHSRVDGQLLSVNFREGQTVHEHQLLLEIDPRPYQAVVDQAVGNYAKDEANLKNAQAEAQRYTALYEAGVVSKEQQQTQVSTSGQAAGTLKADKAAIEAAQVNLGYTKIYSPINGVVGLRQVDPGNIVHASDSTGLVVITQIHPIAAVFTLPEDQLPQVQQAMRGGSKLIVEAYDRTDAHKIAAGTLLTIDNQIDTTTGTAKLKAVFDNADSSLFPNQFVNIRLILRQRANATVIPTAAIQSGTQGTFVFVVNPGPTPANKRQNLPGASGGDAAGGSGGRGGRRKGGSEQPATNQSAASTESSGPGAEVGTTNGDTAGAGGPGGQQGGQPRPQFHVDAVPVHVDFANGTDSVVSDGALKSGQQVVVDGAEKLVDGGNVNPQAGRPRTGNGPGAANSGVGAGASAPNTTSSSGTPANGSDSAQPNPGTAQPNPGTQRQNGQPSSSTSALASGGGHQ